MVVTDDVYGTFVEGFCSLMATIPQNVIAVYSFSKYFGATGWRLGVIAVSQDNIFDRKLAALPEPDQVLLADRYDTLSVNPRAIRFIDRMVADSRQVALNHTAGLSLPQQVQMTLFAIFALLDTDQSYRRCTRAIVTRRLAKLYEGLGVVLPLDTLRAGYYAEIDLARWARHAHGAEFARWLADANDPLEFVVQLADDASVVLLPGGGFDGPQWSVRVSLANLDDERYLAIGDAIARALDDYVAVWRAVV